MMLRIISSSPFGSLFLRTVHPLRNLQNQPTTDVSFHNVGAGSDKPMPDRRQKVLEDAAPKDNKTDENADNLMARSKRLRCAA
jgi:hypothetical protein